MYANLATCERGKKRTVYTVSKFCSPFCSTYVETRVTGNGVNANSYSEILTFMLRDGCGALVIGSAYSPARNKQKRLLQTGFCPCPQKGVLLYAPPDDSADFSLVRTGSHHPSYMGNKGGLMFFLKSWEHCYPNKIKVLAVIVSKKQSLP